MFIWRTLRKEPRQISHQEQQGRSELPLNPLQVVIAPVAAAITIVIHAK